MLAVDVDLLFGTIRTGSADDLAGSGSGDPGEWPPSPARLVSALVAADGTGGNCHVTTGVELLALEGAGPPRIVCDDEADVVRSQLRTRYVVVDAKAPNNMQEYPARTGAEVRLGSRLSPRSTRISYVWDDLDMAPSLVDNVRLRAARVGYLGCADSPARLRVRTEPVDADARAWEAASDGEAHLPVPYVGFVADLDALFERYRRGEWVRRAWLPPERASYRSPARRPSPPARPVPVVLWFRFAGSIAGRHALLVTEALRKATLSAFDLHVLGGSGNLPPVLTGHGFQTAEWEQALFLTLPHVGSAHADGRLHGAAIVVPAAAADIASDLRRALWKVEELRLPGGRAIRFAPYGGERKPFAAMPERWTMPSTRFVSALPVVHEVHRHSGPNLADVTEWCDHAKVAPPIAFRSSTFGMIEGAPVLRPHEVYRPGRPRLPYSHISVTFAEPVRGPIALGRSRTFGLGLLAPVGPELPGA
jgi:CRISPR-associated protein Csb2